MSNQEPPRGQQPDGASGYAQPQDPWAGGFEPGLASVPTDPIPTQYTYGGYPTQQGHVDPWSPATMPAGNVPWVPQQPPKQSKLGYVLLGLLVVVLAGGGGFLAWYLATRSGSPDVTASQGASASASASPDESTSVTESPEGFNPAAVVVGDCVVNNGTNDRPKMAVVTCAAQTYEVLRIYSGSAVDQDDDAILTREEAQATCQDVDGYTNHYISDYSGYERDIIFCMKYRQ